MIAAISSATATLGTKTNYTPGTGTIQNLGLGSNPNIVNASNTYNYNNTINTTNLTDPDATSRALLAQIKYGQVVRVANGSGDVLIA